MIREIFLVGNFSVSLTKDNMVIIDFFHQLNRLEKNKQISETNHNHILLNAVQVKGLRNIFNDLIERIESQIGEIENINAKPIINEEQEHKDVGGYIG